MVWSAGTIRGNDATVIDNNNYWLAQVVNDGMNNAYGGTPTFNNNGMGYLEINPTNGTVTFNQVALNNYGYGGTVAVAGDATVDVASGTLQLGGGGTFTGPFTVEPGANVVLSSGAFYAGNSATLTGRGGAALTGGSLVLSNDISPALLLQGGTVNLGPAFQNYGSITNLTLSGSTLAGTNYLTGTLNWQAGAITGALTIYPTGLLNLSGSAEVYQYAALTNSGQILWNGAGNWEVYNDGSSYFGSIVNLPGGVIAAQCDNSMFQGWGREWFNNAGTFSKSMSTGTTSVGIEFTNTGVVSVQSGSLVFGNGDFEGAFQTTNGTSLTFDSGGVLGATFSAAYAASISFTGGTFSEVPGVAFGGVGTVQMNGGTLTLLNDVPPNLQLNSGTIYLSAVFQGGTITNLTVTGDTLAGSNNVTGVLNLDGNTTGPLVVAPGGVLNWSGGTISGGLNIAPGGVLNLIGPASMAMSSPHDQRGDRQLDRGHFLHHLPKCRVQSRGGGVQH